MSHPTPDAASGDRPVRTRFAPSPTGHLHVGGARTALFCWAFARQRGGTFILRIEDTDQKRSSDAAGQGFLEDLTWLGIDWDEGPEHGGSGGGAHGPYFQSQRLDLYNEHIQRLIDAGHAYPAFETSEELTAARAEARAAKRAYKYDRASLNLPAETVQQYLAEGRPHVIRLRVPDDREIVVNDEVRGEVRIAPGELEDFVIRKQDGFPTYHFAVVVDDELMEITHVVRGEEHLNNTPKHVILQDLLGFQRPTYAHLSLIFNPDGSKMSKRDKDKALRSHVREHAVTDVAAVDAETFATWTGSKDVQLETTQAEALAAELSVPLPEINVDDFRRAGYLPGVVCNYLALLGWSPGDDLEQFDNDLLIEKFSLDRLVRSPARFDRDKLLAFNLDAVQAMSADDFTAALHAHCTAYAPEFIAQLSADGFRLMAEANHERSKTLADPLDSSRFLILPDDAITYQSNKPVRKALANGEPCGWEHLERVRGSLAGLDTWTMESIEEAVRVDAAAHADDKLGKVAQPLRIAVSGTTVSPPIFDVLALLGQSSVVARIDNCLALRPTLFA
ncbi:MAG: glutamate--tRNA ligase [Phycisphaerales bacterium]